MATKAAHLVSSRCREGSSMAQPPCASATTPSSECLRWRTTSFHLLQASHKGVGHARLVFQVEPRCARRRRPPAGRDDRSAPAASGTAAAPSPSAHQLRAPHPECGHVFARCCSGLASLCGNAASKAQHHLHHFLDHEACQEPRGVAHVSSQSPAILLQRSQCLGSKAGPHF